MTNPPNFLVVCTHGKVPDHSRCEHIREDYSGYCTEADRVALLHWSPTRQGWWADETTDRQNIEITLLEGDQRGWSLARMIEGWSESEDYERRVREWYVGRGLDVPDDPRREHIAINCPGEACSTWAYRADADFLQVLLSKIVGEHDTECPKCGQPFVPVVSASAMLIVITLQQLHLARGHAAKHYGLRV